MAATLNDWQLDWKRTHNPTFSPLPVRFEHFFCIIGAHKIEADEPGFSMYSSKNSKMSYDICYEHAVMFGMPVPNDYAILELMRGYQSTHADST